MEESHCIAGTLSLVSNLRRGFARNQTGLGGYIWVLSGEPTSMEIVIVLPSLLLLVKTTAPPAGLSLRVHN